MNIQKVEEYATSGSMSDIEFRSDSDLNSVRLSVEDEGKKLRLSDAGLNYSKLPVNLSVDAVKVGVLTYNALIDDKLNEKVLAEFRPSLVKAETQRLTSMFTNSKGEDNIVTNTVQDPLYPDNEFMTISEIDGIPLSSEPIIKVLKDTEGFQISGVSVGASISEADVVNGGVDVSPRVPFIMLDTKFIPDNTDKIFMSLNVKLKGAKGVKIIVDRSNLLNPSDSLHWERSFDVDMSISENYLAIDNLEIGFEDISRHTKITIQAVYDTWSDVNMYTDYMMVGDVEFSLSDTSQLISYAQPWEIGRTPYETLELTIPHKAYGLPDNRIQYNDTGVTFSKEFLTDEANISGFDSIRITGPTKDNLYSVKDSYNGTIPFDGLYTSYIIVVKFYDNSIAYSKGVVCYFDGELFVNIDGSNIEPPIVYPSVNIPTTDPNYEPIKRLGVNWEYANWGDLKEFMRIMSGNNSGGAGYFIESQHMVTNGIIEYNKEEALYMAVNINKEDFNLKLTETYQILTKALYKAYIYFYKTDYLHTVTTIEGMREFLTTYKTYRDAYRV